MRKKGWRRKCGVTERWEKRVTELRVEWRGQTGRERKRDSKGKKKNQ